MMDSCRDRLNAKSPPEGIVLRALSPDYERIRRARLERRIVNIRRMMAILYAENFSRRSITSVPQLLDVCLLQKELSQPPQAASTRPARALDLPEQDNEPDRPYIAFSATEVTSTVASTQAGEGSWLFRPLRNVRPATCPWLIVERKRPIISLGEHDKPDVTHTDERVKKHVEPIYGTALMASNHPEFNGNPATVGS